MSDIWSENVNVLNQGSSLAVIHSTQIIWLINIRGTEPVLFQRAIKHLGFSVKHVLTDIDWHTACCDGQDFYHLVDHLELEPSAVSSTSCWIYSFTKCSSVWLPFLSGSEGSIKNDKDIKRVNSQWLYGGKRAQLHSRRWHQRQSEESTAPIRARAQLLFVEYFRGLHGEKELMKISLSSELRGVWQKWDQTNQ